MALTAESKDLGRPDGEEWVFELLRAGLLSPQIRDFFRTLSAVGGAWMA